MNYKITFIKGEKKGFSSPLIHNQTLSIGRSHSNSICLQTLDVSGRHIIIRSGSGENITLEILSSRITKINEKDVNIGDILEVSAGDLIQMGEDTAFIIEVVAESSVNLDDDKTALPVAGYSDAADNDSTAPDISHDLPNSKILHKEFKKEKYVSDAKRDNVLESNETIAFQTRIASDDELDNIKKSFRSKQRLRVLSIGIPIIIFFVSAVFLYFYLKPTAEEFVSWPVDDKGEYLNDFQQLSPYLALVYPKSAGSTVETKGNSIRISTRTGKRLDVPLYIIAINQKDATTLNLDHKMAFELWLDQVRNREQTISWKGDKTTTFINESKGAGVPVSYVSYIRRFGNDDFFGYAIYLRNADNIHTAMIEVPIAHQWRAERFLRNNVTSMIIYAIRRTAEHWEGTASFRRDTTSAKDLEEAANFMKREAPVYWEKIFYRIRSALIKATAAGDKSTVNEAIGMLIEIREQQTKWYSTQKLAYQYAEQNGDRNAMHSIQSACDSVFSSEFQQSDFRYDRIRRKDWK